MYISVVIPLYNKADSIERAMGSVIQQMSDNVELIVVDDGSVDESRGIAQALMQLHPHLNIRVHAQENRGVSAARNAGIDQASGDFVAFLDADDSYDPDFLIEITRLINAFPAAAMFATGYRFCNSSTGAVRDAKITGLAGSCKAQLLDDFFHSAATGDLPVTSSSVCIRKAALVEVGGFPENENMGEDQAVWSQLALHHSIALSNSVCATYYEGFSNSLMQSVSPIDEMPYSKRLQLQLNQGLVPAQFKSSLTRYIAGHLFDLVRRNLGSTNPAAARQLLRDSRTKADLPRWIYWHLRLLLNKFA